MKLQQKIAPKHVLTQMLHQSLAILQLPQLELSALILKEIEKNPLLELESEFVLEPNVTEKGSYTISFHDQILLQIREALPGREWIGEKLLQELDERGYLCTPLCELATYLGISLFELEEVVSILKTLDPPGLFASNLQESLLIQLRRQQKHKTMLYKIVGEAFEEILAGRFSKVQKKLHICKADLHEALRGLFHLSLCPMGSKEEPAAPIYPDFRIEQMGDAWAVIPIEESLPKFRINTIYQKAPLCSTVRGFLASAKLLLRSIQRRKDLLSEMMNYLVHKQSAFFEGGQLVPIATKALANKFGVHESTIFRATLHKYIESPRGFFPMRMLIPTSLQRSMKEMVQYWTQQESARRPLTDAQLALKLEKLGYKVARRTIAKYRKQLKIRKSFMRKNLSQ